MEMEDDVEVVVIGLAGEICRFVARPSWAVSDAKNAIEAATAICPRQQRLVAGVVELRDDDKLGAFLVEDTAYLTLVKRSPEQARWLDLADKDWSQLLDAPADVWADFEVVRIAVSRCGWALKHAVPELRGDPEVVLDAVRQNGLSLQFAAAALKADRTIAVAAAVQCGRALDFVVPELRNDRAFVLDVVRRNGRALEHCDDMFQADRDVVLAAVVQSGYALASAATDLRADHEVVAAAIAQDRSALIFAARELKEYFNTLPCEKVFQSDTSEPADQDQDDAGKHPIVRRRKSSMCSFTRRKSEGHSGMSGVLGNTGALLCEMANLGLPVVPGFCMAPGDVPTDGTAGGTAAGASAGDAGRNDDMVKEAIAKLEQTTGRYFGSLVMPLLLSVRQDEDNLAGGEHLANIGLTDAIVESWASRDNPRFIWDSYRRLIFNFSRLVKKLDMAPFENALLMKKQRLDGKCMLGRKHEDCDMPTNDLKGLVEEYKALYKSQVGDDFPQDPGLQLSQTLHMILKPPSAGEEGAECAAAGDGGSDGCGPTAIVQAMAFGNYNSDSVAGVARLARSAGGHRTELHGEWLANAQHDDLAAGKRSTSKLTVAESREWAKQAGIPEDERMVDFPSLEERMPAVYTQLVHYQDVLSSHVAEAKSVEFLVQQGRLWILQPRVREPTKGKQPLCDKDLSSCNPEQQHVYPEVNDVEMLASKIQAGLPSLEAFEGQAAWGECIGEIDEEPVAACYTPALGALAGGLSWSWASGAWVPAAAPLASALASPRATGVYLGRTSLVQPLGLGRRLPRVARAWARRRGARAAFSAAAAAEAPKALQPSAADDGAPWAMLPKLPLWQTALAGGLAGISTQLAAGNAAACTRALPAGALCCTGYVNLLNFASEEGDLDSVPVAKRLACAGMAASAATATMHVAGGLLACSPLRVAFAGFGAALGRTVPSMAIEMCTIDVVKTALVGDDESSVTPGVLLCAGGAAGLLSQSLLQPIGLLASRVRDIGAPGRARALVPVLKSMGPAFRRSIPGAAANSLVRVGLVTHFLHVQTQ
mmetsp:Transcript_150576/g.484175  ORF Transcript_150576/g.484175 Transcript_150576/m.484175 type:complete len:1049 (+) Transcript_150576:74-3220(+)|eukprot:CAMPEP_0203954634 /NCGR_PEP_ID=MMETSP0359-20131031/87563_1 /ASSEMBLY_ACC=CAM_ASM_000338 /TAXON_ID=268821 /ORGANISM="Scrippsiella Hangoei, Strain SHTV-5" /LENGTH=1048 /DNA_ID=CAMNT_0050888169 /DNA_START=30 /DNA_END=3176 /DNA_ORIENTATION=+